MAAALIFGSFYIVYVRLSSGLPKQILLGFWCDFSTFISGSQFLQLNNEKNKTVGHLTVDICMKENNFDNSTTVHEIVSYTDYPMQMLLDKHVDKEVKASFLKLL